MNLSKAWAISTTSPDNAADSSSSTGKTQSSRTWALYSKDRAAAAKASENAAKASATSASTNAVEIQKLLDNAATALLDNMNYASCMRARIGDKSYPVVTMTENGKRVSINTARVSSTQTPDNIKVWAKI